MGVRTQSHSEGKEPLLEYLFGYLRFRRAKKFLSYRKDLVVLDIGCGFNGKFLGKMTSLLKKGYGVDISINKRVNGKKIELIALNVEKPLPFDDNYFDVVTSLANIEHLDVPEYSIQEVYRVLKPGGVLILTTPSTYAKPILEFMALRLHLVSVTEIMDHKNYFNKKSLVVICRNAGFREIKHSYFQMFMNNSVYAKK